MSDFELAGDQARAIGELTEGLERGDPHQVLLGVTGSGKTFTMAQTIARVNRPTLVMVHNKTLAAQLFQEFRRFFPDNAVEYFVSYYDYYQPEAYVPATDSYIEKEATINDEIDRMRLSATRSLFERRDVIIVASVSCIYGLGSPEAYYGMLLPLERGQRIGARARCSASWSRSSTSATTTTSAAARSACAATSSRSIPSYEEQGLRIELFGDEVDELDLVRSADRQDAPAPRQDRRLSEVALRRAARADAGGRSSRSRRSWPGTGRSSRREGKLLEAQRLHQRTMFDLEMIREIGYCHGIENYARHLTGRAPGEPPPTLLDYLPNDALIIVDESHQTVPQIRGMYHGDRSRKEVLVAYGFRLPSALDNRPLNFEEWEARVGQVVFVSATPGPYELSKSQGVVVEQIIRPTGLIDPPIDVRPVKGQVDDLLQEIRARAARGERVLVTTLTKRMAEDLTQYYQELGRARALPALRHRDARARRDPARSAARRVRRAGRHQPAARGARSARGVAGGDSRRRQGRVPAIGRLADPDVRPRGPERQRPRHHVRRHGDRFDARARSSETDRRRALQEAYNVEHGITPQSIVKQIDEVMSSVVRARLLRRRPRPLDGTERFRTQAELDAHIATLQERDARRGGQPRLREGRGAPRRHQAPAQPRAGAAVAGAEGLTPRARSSNTAQDMPRSRCRSTSA